MDITTRSFGLLIAYLLPGLGCFIFLSFWLEHFETLQADVLDSSSTLGSLLLLLLISLILGLILNALRWLLYERIFLHKHVIPAGYFAQIVETQRLEAMHTAIDENFRYHQFYGSLSLVLPGCAWGLIADMEGWQIASLLVVAASIIIEVVVVWTAVFAFLRYVKRCCAFMAEAGGENA